MLSGLQRNCLIFFFVGSWKRKLGGIGVGCCKGKLTIQNSQCIYLGNNIVIGNYTYFFTLLELCGEKLCA